VLFVVSDRRGLLPFVVPQEMFRHGVIASTLPVVVFVASIPLAFATNSTLALLSWILIWPLETLVDKLKPFHGPDRWPQA
jgi:hypothetical protein